MKNTPYEPFVSIAVTTYNGNRYLLEQIESLLVQTYTNLEVVMSDDGSDEETLEIMNALVARDPRVRWSRNPGKRGFVPNNENAISLCRGEIIFLCDQDDTWYPEKVARHVERYRDPRTVWVYNRLVLTDGAGKQIGLIEDSIPDYYRHKTMSENAWGSCIGGAMTSYRADVLKRAMPADPEAPAHDSWIQLMLNPKRGVFIDEVLQTYRQHGGNEVGFTPNFTPEELEDRERQAIRDNLRYVRSLYHNPRLALWKRAYFLALYAGKRARTLLGLRQ